MSLHRTTFAALAAAALAMPGQPALADSQIAIHDAYARAAGASAMTGAAFMQIVNSGDRDDRLIEARSDAARRVELHTHIETDEGVMQMREVPGGFPIAAGATHVLKRGGDHVMFMGLTAPFGQGRIITVTLVFEQAGEVEVDISVDLERRPMTGMGTGSGG